MADKKISQLDVSTSPDGTSLMPLAFDGTDLAVAINDLRTLPLVLEASSVQPSTVDHGLFWDGPDVEVEGEFFWEWWAAPVADAQYVISEGNGGAHALLAGFLGGNGTSAYIKPGGNVFNGSLNTSWGSFEGVAADEWCHVGIGWDGSDWLIVYLNGIPSGMVAFAGPRVSQQGWLYICGSDHSNFRGRLHSVRGWEGFNPIKNLGKFSAFAPSRVFRPTIVVSSAVTDCQFLAFYNSGRQDVPDLSAGYRTRRHHGIVQCTATGLNNGDYREVPAAFPMPLFRVDDRVPANRLYSVAPIPASIPLVPPSTPGGAIVFDSFSRDDQNFAFPTFSGFSVALTLGSTEAGSAGPKVWEYPASGPVQTPANTWGIHKGRAVFLGSSAGAAVVDTGTANQDVRVDRVRNDTSMPFGETGLILRYVDQDNFLLVYFSPYGTTPDTCTLYMYPVVAGVLGSRLVEVTLGTTDWTTLRANINSSNTLTIFTDATLRATVTGVTQGATGTKAGIVAYFLSTKGLSRWDNFTVLAAS